MQSPVKKPTRQQEMSAGLPSPPSVRHGRLRPGMQTRMPNRPLEMQADEGEQRTFTCYTAPGVSFATEEEMKDGAPRMTQQKYGASTTWMGKLIYRLNAGRNGGCPVLAIGIGPGCISDWPPAS